MQAVFAGAELAGESLGADKLTQDGGPADFPAGTITTPGITESTTLEITDVSAGTFIVTLTNPAKTVTINVTAVDTKITVAGKIISALGTVTGYNVTDNGDGTITLTATATNQDVDDLTFSIN